MLNSRDLVDRLEDKEYKDALPFLRSFRHIAENKHGNSLLHEAIAWNRTFAAVYIITLAATHDPDALKIKDLFPSSNSTPLILASKTGNNETALLLLGLSKSAGMLNQQDYIGNTALHYACLMRNNVLIEALLLKGAQANIRNDAGESPLECYETSAIEKDLAYYYGAAPGEPNLMHHVCDWDKEYQGTKKPCFSNYRWFLAHIITNLGLAEAVALNLASGPLFMFAGQNAYKLLQPLDKDSTSHIIKTHIEQRSPVIDMRLYLALAKTFVDYRIKNYTEACISQLQSAMTLR